VTRIDSNISAIPQDVQVLLHTQVDSFEALRILLWMHTFRSKRWCESQLQVQLRLTSALDSALNSLTAAGLIKSEKEGGEAYYSYAPTTLALARAVSRLQRRFKTHPLVIMQLMSNNAIDRVRGSAARAFADAFLFGKGKPRG
jgi:hypothetical protein